MSNNKNNVTELVFILDRSGSMQGLEGDVIGGFNSMLEKQKKLDGEAYVSTMLFDNESKVIHDRVPIQKVKPMTERDYRVGGCTALLDAIGGAIHHIGNIHKYARPEDVPEHTVFIITTDGMENASHSYGSDRVKEMIKCRSEQDGWEFIFLAANIDAVETAEGLGIRRERAVNYRATPCGTRMCYDAVEAAVGAVRCRRSIDDTSWRSNLDEENDR